MERAHGELVDFVSDGDQVERRALSGQYIKGNTNAHAHRGVHGWYIKIDHCAPLGFSAPSKEDPGENYGPGGCFPQRPETSLALLWNTNTWSCVSPVHRSTLHVFDSSGSRTAVLESGFTAPAQTPLHFSRFSHVTTAHPQIFCASVRDIVLNPIELVVVINALFVLPVRMSVHHFSMMLESYEAKAIIVTQDGMRNVHSMLVDTQTAPVAECRFSAWPDNTIFVDDESDETISLILFNTSRKLEDYSLQASKPDVYIQFPRPITIISKDESVDAGTTYLRIRGSNTYTQIELYLFDIGADDDHDVPSFYIYNSQIKCDVVSLQKETPQYKRMNLIHLACHASFDPIGLMGDQVSALIENLDSDLDSATSELVNAGLLTLQSALQSQSLTQTPPRTYFTPPVSSGLTRQTSVHWQV